MVGISFQGTAAAAVADVGVKDSRAVAKRPAARTMSDRVTGTHRSPHDRRPSLDPTHAVDRTSDADGPREPEARQRLSAAAAVEASVSSHCVKE